MKLATPRNAQTTLNYEYAGSDELWAAEKFLVNYNQDLITKLTKNLTPANDVLEFGAGIGTLANLWAQRTGIKPECLEIDPKQRPIIEARGFRCHSAIQDIEQEFDVIYTSNVLEHIDDDQQALRYLYAKLKPSGTLIIYVPAFQVLYSKLDEKIGHYRRYEKKDLLAKLRRAGFVVREASYADCIGFFAWLYIKIRGYSEQKAQDKSMQIYDRYIFPVSKIFDALGCKYIFGKNILVYAQKPHSPNR